MGVKEQGTDNLTIQGRWQVIPRTLCFVTHGDDILLMKRSPHKRIFPNHYNGLGGHIERDEDPQTGAIREIKEESDLDVVNVRYCGSTHVDVGNEVGIMLYVFSATATSHDFMANDEGELEWLNLPQLLADLAADTCELLLVEDLPIVLPMIFGENAQSHPYFAHVSYDDADQIVFRLAE